MVQGSNLGRSSLFRDPEDEHKILVALDARDTPSGARRTTHTFTARTGDHHDIDDSLPKQAD